MVWKKWKVRTGKCKRCLSPSSRHHSSCLFISVSWGPFLWLDAVTGCRAGSSSALMKTSSHPRAVHSAGDSASICVASKAVDLSPFRLFISLHLSLPPLSFPFLHPSASSCRLPSRCLSIYPSPLAARGINIPCSECPRGYTSPLP